MALTVNLAALTLAQILALTLNFVLSREPRNSTPNPDPIPNPNPNPERHDNQVIRLGMDHATKADLSNVRSELANVKGHFSELRGHVPNPNLPTQP